jgi:hypothetical protein
LLSPNFGTKPKFDLELKLRRDLDILLPPFKNSGSGDTVFGTPSPDIAEQDEKLLEWPIASFRLCTCVSDSFVPKRDELIHRGLVTHQGIEPPP